jgi:hypothetical protein
MRLKRVLRRLHCPLDGRFFNRLAKSVIEAETKREENNQADQCEALKQRQTAGSREQVFRVAPPLCALSPG